MSEHEPAEPRPPEHEAATRLLSFVAGVETAHRQSAEAYDQLANRLAAAQDLQRTLEQQKAEAIRQRIAEQSTFLESFMQAEDVQQQVPLTQRVQAAVRIVASFTDAPRDAIDTVLSRLVALAETEPHSLVLVDAPPTEHALMLRHAALVTEPARLIIEAANFSADSSYNQYPPVALRLVVSVSCFLEESLSFTLDQKKLSKNATWHRLDINEMLAEAMGVASPRSHDTIAGLRIYPEEIAENYLLQQPTNYREC